MIKTILRTGALTLVAVALAGMPARVAAQSTNAAGASKKAANEKAETTPNQKKKSSHPFHGKLAKVDKTAKTITVGQSVYQLSADTKITKNGKTATLEDAVDGEQVSGYVKPDSTGKLVATSVTFGAPIAKRGTAQGAEKSADKKQASK